MLILDNCEHLVDACAHVANTLLQSCARMQLLATSRELLGIAGEATWRVASLSVIDPRDTAGSGNDLAAKLLASQSGRLFVDRAQLAVPSFAITAQNAAAVAQVCQRLDGIPLASELAAARLSMLSVDQIAARLDRRFRLLTGGNRTAASRQQTLQATVDWSYQLLSDEERSLVRGLAVFAGGWSLEAAEALGTVAVGPQADMLELLSRLVAKSMVLVEESRENETSVARYRFLETIRQYAEEKLVDADDAEMMRTHHRDWYRGLAEQGLRGMEGADQRRWWDRLELEHDNLHAALTWSAADRNGSQALLHLAGLLGRFWEARGYGSEGIGWLKMALAQSETTPSSVRARALNWLGQLESRNGNIERACPSLEESVVQARTVRDQRVLSMALRHLSLAVRGMGDQARALLLIEEALAVSRAQGYQREIAWNLAALGLSLASAGLLDPTEAVLLESISVGRACGDITPVLVSTVALARLYLRLGDLTRARRTVHETLALTGQIDVKLPIADLLIVLGDVASAERDWESADMWYRRALSVASVLAARGMIAHTLRQYAAMCATRGNLHRAVRILGAAAPVRDFPGSVMMNPKGAENDIVAVTRRTLGEDAFGVAWAEAESITLEQVTAEILSEDNKKFSRP